MCAVKIYFLISIAALFTFCDAYKILVVFPYPARSHGILGDGVVRHLLRAGHEVTYITAYPYSDGSSNLRLIDVSENAKLLPDTMYNFRSLINEAYKIEYDSFIRLLIKQMENTILMEDVQKILNDPNEQFDAVIADWCLNELLTGLAVIFDCPFIWFSSLDTHWYILRLVDQASNPAYTADIFSPNVPPFSFMERITELYNQLHLEYLNYMYFDVLESNEYRNLFTSLVEKRGKQLPSYEDVQYNASLVLSSSHASMGKAVPVPQNFKDVGGYYIEEKLQPLPESLKTILDNARNGVIYFSMGSNLKSKDIPKEMQYNILKMFSELSQIVLWKFEEDLPEMPQNVHIIKWAPQHSILAHPNVILFITHGGLLSTTEAIHFGVPIIGIPVFLDQFANIAKIVKQGMGLKVHLSHNLAEELKIAVEQVINCPRYTAKAKEMSFIYHDRPVKPGIELVHWVKHVIETRGALHLRSPAVQVAFYQKLYLDLLAVILIILFITIRLKYVFYYLANYVFSYLNSKIAYFIKKLYRSNKHKNI